MEDKGKEKTNEMMKLFRLKATREILNYLNEHGNAHYTELQQIASTYTLTMRLRSLRRIGLVEHHLERRNVRKEWYTITEKGRRVLEIMTSIQELLKEGKSGVLW